MSTCAVSSDKCGHLPDTGFFNSQPTEQWRWNGCFRSKTQATATVMPVTPDRDGRKGHFSMSIFFVCMKSPASNR